MGNLKLLPKGFTGFVEPFHEEYRAAELLVFDIVVEFVDDFLGEYRAEVFLVDRSKANM